MTWTRADLLKLSDAEQRFAREVPDLPDRGPITHLIHIGKALLIMRGFPERDITGPELDTLATVRLEPLRRKQ